MSFQKYVTEEGVLFLFDEEQNYASLRMDTEQARVLSLSVPEGETEKAAALLRAAETAAHEVGCETICSDFPKAQEMLFDVFSKGGYGLTETDRLISVQTAELLASAGVQKSLRMKFSNVETTAFSELMSFQKDEVYDFLEKLKFPISVERLDEVGQSISAVTYNEDYEPMAVLLATCLSDEILVELLVGFSAKHPQYILSVCQKFLEGLMEEDMEDVYPRIKMLTVNEGVLPLLRRLLDKEYAITTEDVILHATKEVSAGSEELFKVDSMEDWEEPRVLLRDNINAKYIWLSDRKK